MTDNKTDKSLKKELYSIYQKLRTAILKSNVIDREEKDIQSNSFLLIIK